MLTILGWLVTATIATAATNYQDCVLAGPDFPSPSQLSNSKFLAEATARFEDQLQNSTLGLKANDTAWAVALFSSKENKTLYEYYYTPPIDVGVKKVDKNSIFRIGSVSKVFSVWSFLIEAGDKYFNDPITKYVPELANLPVNTEPDALYDDINVVRWEEVTLGELASHAAGIPRDPTTGDLSTQMSQEVAEEVFGLPPLNKSEALICDFEGGRPCSRKEMFGYLLKQHPIYAPQQSPGYSNIAYTLLGYAMETITGKGFNITVKSGIIDALGMKDSSYEKTPQSGGVIPGNNATDPEVGWQLNIGEAAPAGSFYSSTADMVTAVQAMMQSRLISPGETRRWLKPLIQTGYLTSPVGAPWEIRYLPSANQHLVEVYTKQGDIGNYHAGIAFSTQHDLGWVVLTGGAAGVSAEESRNELFNAFSDFFIPAVEEQAKMEAITNFDGKYVDEATNSSLTIVVADNGRAGLGITSLISRGVEVIGPSSPLISKFHAGQSGRLYPSQLRTVKKKSNEGGVYDARLGFKTAFFNETGAGELVDPCLKAWTALGAPVYGQVSLDDWVFEMGEDGKAEVADVRMWRLRLKRV